MKKIYLFLSGMVGLVWLLSGCVTPRAEFQNRVYQPQKKGTIRYRLEPVLFQSDAVQQRRMDAEMKMENFCQPKKPTIVSERKQEKEVGFKTNVSYHDSERSNTRVRDQAYSGRYRYGGSGSSETDSLNRGSTTSHSKPVIETYNVIRFECQ